MRHSILTCKNHPNLRWSCKHVAFTPGHGYNGSRFIFFKGEPDGKGMFPDASGLSCSTYFPEREIPTVVECSCPPSDLILAPEDALVSREYD